MRLGIYQSNDSMTERLMHSWGEPDGRVFMFLAAFVRGVGGLLDPAKRESTKQSPQ